MTKPPFAHKTTRPSVNKQGGYTLIELIMVIGLTAAATMLTFSEKTLQMEQMQAKDTGQILHRYNEGVRTWLRDHPNAPNTVYAGTSWLKPSTCGGLNVKAYLPCSFDQGTASDPIRFGMLSLQTSVLTTLVDGEPVTSAQTETSAFTVRGRTRADLAGLAAITAAAGQVTSASAPLMASGNGSTQSDTTTARINMHASSHSTDGPWLRTDGSNTMDAPLRFGESKNANQREIQGVSRLQNIAGEVLNLGRSGGAVLSDKVMVDANQQLLGALIVANQGNESSGIEVTQGNILTLDGDASGRDVTAREEFFAREFRDDVSGFVVKPSGHSVVSDLITPGDASDPTIGKFEANIYVDPDDNYYDMNPAGDSHWMNLTIQELRVAGRSRDGDPCGYMNPVTGVHHPADGMIATQTDGTLLTCMRAGYMAAAIGKPTFALSSWVTNANVASAVCPAPRVVTGGICHVRNGSAASDLAGAKSGNGWACQSNKTDAEVQAQAFCR